MVGGFALQLASGRGARVVAAVRESDADEARRLGAETVVNANELEAEVRGEWQDGVDACLDTVGLGSSASVCVRDGGAFVTSVPEACPRLRGESLLGPCKCSPTPMPPPSWRIAPPRVS